MVSLVSLINDATVGLWIKMSDNGVHWRDDANARSSRVLECKAPLLKRQDDSRYERKRHSQQALPI
jgi:hypothetical protein